MRRLLFSLVLAVALSTQVLATDQSAPAASPGTMPREVVINGVEFMHVPEGWFWHIVGTGDHNLLRGGQSWFREVRIWLDGYYIAKYEARARDFKAFIDSGSARHLNEYAQGERAGCAIQRRGDGGEWFLTRPDLDLPVTHLSWNLADEFARWMGFRLPRETEWVKAARGTDRRTYPWGDEYPDDTFGGFGAASGCNPSPVTAFPNGKSPYGAYNMSGNVLELVQDWENHAHDAALSDGERNPPAAAEGSIDRGANAPLKIAKGGRWGSVASFMTIHKRRLLQADAWFICYGTRFAVDESVVRDHLAKGTARIVEP